MFDPNIPDMKENARRYWKEHAGHFLIPAIAMAIAVLLTPIAVAVPAFMCWRQYVEFLRRGDTPGIDLAYIIAGAFAGLLVAAGILLYHQL